MKNKILVVAFTILYVLEHWKPKYLGDEPVCTCGNINDHDSECEIELYALGLGEFLVKKLGVGDEFNPS